MTFMQGMVGNQVNITIDVELVNGNAWAVNAARLFIKRTSLVGLIDRTARPEQGLQS